MVTSLALAHLAPVALASLIPLVAGTTPHDPAEGTISVALCDGGSMAIDLGRDQQGPRRDCETKACHAGACREKLKSKGTAHTN